MVDLSTTYLGLKLRNPIVASSSPLMQHVDNVKRMEDAGVAAVVLHSLFEEQIVRESFDLDHYLDYGSESFAEAVSYFPDLQTYNKGPEGYLEHLRKVKQAVRIPVIASLNGFSPGGWLRFAKEMQEAGADALELNMYYVAANPDQSCSEIEAMYLDLVNAVRAVVTIPIAIKLGSQFTALANFATRLADRGANGLVLFNRFYQPDFDLETLDVLPTLDLSHSYELRLRLQWVAMLHGRVNADLAITGGVHSGTDAIKALMAGAKVAMMTSALLHNGIDHLHTVLNEMQSWLDEKEYRSIAQLCGSMSYSSVDQPAAFERANYMKVLRAYRPVPQSAIDG